MPKGERIGFVQIRLDLFESGELSSREFHLLACLISRCNPVRDHGELVCWPSNGTLATAMDCSKAQMWRALTGLEKKGFVSRMFENGAEGPQRRFILAKERISCAGMGGNKEAAPVRRAQREEYASPCHKPFPPKPKKVRR